MAGIGPLLDSVRYLYRHGIAHQTDPRRAGEQDRRAIAAGEAGSAPLEIAKLGDSGLSHAIENYVRAKPTNLPASAPTEIPLSSAEIGKMGVPGTVSQQQAFFSDLRQHFLSIYENEEVFNPLTSIVNSGAGNRLIFQIPVLSTQVLDLSKCYFAANVTATFGPVPTAANGVIAALQLPPYGWEGLLFTEVGVRAQNKMILTINNNYAQYCLTESASRDYNHGDLADRAMQHRNSMPLYGGYGGTGQQWFRTFDFGNAGTGFTLSTTAGTSYTFEIFIPFRHPFANTREFCVTNNRIQIVVQTASNFCTQSLTWNSNTYSVMPYAGMIAAITSTTAVPQSELAQITAFTINSLQFCARTHSKTQSYLEHMDVSSELRPSSWIISMPNIYQPAQTAPVVFSGTTFATRYSKVMISQNMQVPKTVSIFWEHVPTVQQSTLPGTIIGYLPGCVTAYWFFAQRFGVRQYDQNWPITAGINTLNPLARFERQLRMNIGETVGEPHSSAFRLSTATNETIKWGGGSTDINYGELTSEGSAAATISIRYTAGLVEGGTANTIYASLYGRLMDLAFAQQNIMSNIDPSVPGPNYCGDFALDYVLPGLPTTQTWWPADPFYSNYAVTVGQTIVNSSTTARNVWVVAHYYAIVTLDSKGDSNVQTLSSYGEPKSRS